MTKEQFEALKQWFDRRTYLLTEMRQNSRDTPRINSLTRQLAEADEQAEMILVEQPRVDHG